MREDRKNELKNEALAQVFGGTEELTEDEKFALLFQEAYRLLELFPQKEVDLNNLIRTMEDYRNAGCNYEYVKDYFFRVVASDQTLVCRGGLLERLPMLP